MRVDKQIDQDWLKMVQAVDFSRMLGEQEQANRTEIRRILLDFLDVLDSLDRLIAHSDSASTNLSAIRRQLLASFERAGVRFLESLNQPFDPQTQEAVEARPDPATQRGLVIEELRRGCEWQGDMLRMAQVVVASQS